MSDCTNLEIRELLPEYVHGRLGALEIRWVETHVASCAECASELSLLRSVRQAYGRVPAVNAATIAGALPRPRPARRRWSTTPAMLRIAAVVSFISLGGISLVTLRGFLEGGGQARTDTAIAVNRVDDTSRGAGGSESVSGAPAISFGGGVSDLEAEDLVALLSAVDALEAVPPADPEEYLLSGAGRGGS